MSYEYYNQIKSPAQLGMSGNGSMGTLSRNVESLVDYVKLLVEGGGSASKTGQPLGNKYFIDTGASCEDNATGKKVDRYMYIDNQPDGDVPFIGAGMGTSFSQFRGLIPGVLEDVNDINPVRIMEAFLEGGTPKCTRVTLKTIDKNNTMRYETHHVPDEELQTISACDFRGRTNPVSKKRCEGFTTMTQMKDMSSFGQGTMFERDVEDVEWREPRDRREDILVGGVSLVLLYFVWKMYRK